MMIDRQTDRDKNKSSSNKSGLKLSVCRMPPIPALWRQRQVEHCEFKASLVYIVCSRKARALQKDPISKYKQNIQNKNKPGLMLFSYNPSTGEVEVGG